MNERIEALQARVDDFHANLPNKLARKRLEGIAECLRAIRGLGTVACADLLSDHDDVCALAQALEVPVMFITLLDCERDNCGPISAREVNELAAWPHRDLVEVK